MSNPRTRSAIARPERHDNSVPPKLLLHQLSGSVCVDSIPDEHKRDFWTDVVALHEAISPNDALESIAANMMVAVNNATMEAFARAANGRRTPAELDLSLRQGFKGVAAYTELMKALDSRRGLGRQNLTVNRLNMENGAQAIVGNFDVSQSEQPPHPTANSRRSSKAIKRLPPR